MADKKFINDDLTPDERSAALAAFAAIEGCEPGSLVGVGNWRYGPVPAGILGAGAIVAAGNPEYGMYFAYFLGNVVRLPGSDEFCELGDVILYDNSLTMPPRLAEHKHP